ncbi:MAG: tetratricopeptide repeat protein [Thiotrichaceae bacterium]|nr:tetratricopeptide repeat protein [Thiotrichaceae bacterium]
MPLIMLSVIIQAIFIVHAHKTGRRDWIWILLVIPVAGCIFYFFLEVLPDMRNSRTGRKTVQNVLKTIDPERDLKRLAKELAISENTQNKLNLAEECIANGFYQEAINLYNSSLVGLYKTDPKIMLSLAQVLFLNQQYAEAKTTLERLIAENPDFKSQEGHLLYARTLEYLGENEAALAEYKTLAVYFSGYEAKCRYALLLQKLGYTEQAHAMFKEILARADTMPSNFRKVQQEWIKIAKQQLS